MPEDEDIFAAAGKGKKPKKPAAKKRKKSPPKPPPTDEEVEKMLKRMENLKRDLEKKLEELYGEKGLTYTQVNDYLEREANFTPQEWEMIEKKRDEVKEQMTSQFAKGAAKKKKMVKKKRKGKMLGARKKWLSMD